MFDSGRTAVFGVMTGAFRGFLKQPVQSITDQELTLSQLAGGGDIDLATLAQALGCYDQSHFTTDFEKLVGKPPADYRRSCKEHA